MNKEMILEPLRKYADFQGRSRRAEYWWFYLAQLIVNVVLQILSRTPAIGMIFALILGLISLGLIVPNLAVGFRRLHDTNRSAWWLLLAFVPILGWIALIVFLATPGDKGENQYGPDPLGAPGDVAEAFA